MLNTNLFQREIKCTYVFRWNSILMSKFWHYINTNITSYIAHLFLQYLCKSKWVCTHCTKKWLSFQVKICTFSSQNKIHLSIKLLCRFIFWICLEWSYSSKVWWSMDNKQKKCGRKHKWKCLLPPWLGESLTVCSDTTHEVRDKTEFRI
jgi:hypothetical protein